MPRRRGGARARSGSSRLGGGGRGLTAGTRAAATGLGAQSMLKPPADDAAAASPALRHHIDLKLRFSCW